MTGNYRSNFISRGRIFSLIVVLLILVAFPLVVLAVSPKQKSTPRSTNTTAEVNQNQATLTVNEPKSLGGGQYQAEVSLNSGDLYATGADLYLTYDPKVLGNVVVTRGSFVTNPIELLNKVDPVAGAITYSINTTAGTIAVITFSVIGTPSASTSIDFSDNTVVTAEGYARSVLKKATGITFTPNSLSPQ